MRSQSGNIYAEICVILGGKEKRHSISDRNRGKTVDCDATQVSYMPIDTARHALAPLYRMTRISNIIDDLCKYVTNVETNNDVVYKDAQGIYDARLERLKKTRRLGTR